MNTENHVATITLSQQYTQDAVQPKTCVPASYPCGEYTVHTQCMYRGDELLDFRLEVHGLAEIVSWSTTIAGCARAWQLYMASSFVTHEMIDACEDDALAAMYQQCNLISMTEVITAPITHGWANLAMPITWHVGYTRVMRELQDPAVARVLLELHLDDESLRHRTVLKSLLKRRGAWEI